MESDSSNEQEQRRPKTKKINRPKKRSGKAANQTRMKNLPIKKGHQDRRWKNPETDKKIWNLHKTKKPQQSDVVAESVRSFDPQGVSEEPAASQESDVGGPRDPQGVSKGNPTASQGSPDPQSVSEEPAASQESQGSPECRSSRSRKKEIKPRTPESSRSSKRAAATIGKKYNPKKFNKTPKNNKSIYSFFPVMSKKHKTPENVGIQNLITQEPTSLEPNANPAEIQEPQSQIQEPADIQVPRKKLRSAAQSADQEVIATTPTKKYRLSADQEVIATTPTMKYRRRGSNPSPHNRKGSAYERVLSGCVKPGDRLAMRKMVFKSKLVKKPKVFSPEYCRIPKKLINDISSGERTPAVLFCNYPATPRSKVKKCKGKVKIQIGATGHQLPLTLTCTKCTRRSLFKFDEQELDGYARMPSTIPEDPQRSFSIDHLKHVAVSLVGSRGYEQYKRFMSSLSLTCLDEKSYYRYANQIYNLQDESFCEYQRRTIKEIHVLYKDIAHRKGEEIKLINGLLPILISSDGSYPKRGHQSLICVNFIIEAYTGSVIDICVVRRCTKCSDHKKLGTHCNSGLFHGTANDMEVETVKILFGRSKELGLMYQHMISDGDSTAWNSVKNTYGSESVFKIECMAHYQKRLWKHFDAAIHNLAEKRLTKNGLKKKLQWEEWEKTKKENPKAKQPELEVMLPADWIVEYPLRGENDRLKKKNRQKIQQSRHHNDAQKQR